MSTPVTFNGQTYNVPAYNDTGYAQGNGNLSSYLIAIATSTLQQTGGAFTLTADTNFGGSFGLVSLYFKSRSANIAGTGVLRLADGDAIAWRNHANSADISLAKNTSDALTYAGAAIVNSSGQVSGTFATLTSATASPASAGQIQLASGDAIDWRNNANTANIALSKNSSDVLLFNGVQVSDGVNSNVNAAGSGLTKSSQSLTLSAPVSIANGGTNSTATLNNSRVMVSSAGAIVEASAITATSLLQSNGSGIPIASSVAMNAAGYPVGSVVQTVTATGTTGQSTTSGSFVDTTFGVSIAPKATTHKVRITCSFTGQVGAGTGFYTIFRGIAGTNLGATNGLGCTSTIGQTQITLDVLDSPATTVATTYEVYYKNSGAGNTTRFGDSGNGITYTIIAQELAA